MPGIVRCAAVGIALVATLAACDSRHGAGTSPSSASSGPAKNGSGTATLAVGSQRHSFEVVCARTAAGTQGIASSGSDDVTLTVEGATRAAVLVSHGSDGSTTIYQALPGLRDDAGRPVGKLSVSGGRGHYSGSGTFVLTKIDAQGKRVKLTSDTAVAGNFTLSCPNGLAALPVPSAAPKQSLDPSSKTSAPAPKSSAAGSTPKPSGAAPSKSG
jgi:hypothetical protein